MLRRVSLKMRYVLNLSFLNMQLVYMFRIPLPIDSGSNFLSVRRIPYFLEKGGGIPGLILLRERERDLSTRQTNNESPRIQRSGHMEEDVFLCPLGSWGTYLLSRGELQIVDECHEG